MEKTTRDSASGPELLGMSVLQVKVRAAKHVDSLNAIARTRPLTPAECIALRDYRRIEKLSLDLVNLLKGFKPLTAHVMEPYI